MGIEAVAIFSEADRHARHVRMADRAFRVGPAAAAASYLNIERIVEVCHEAGVDAVHPGYGFLSENAAFAERLGDAGVTFIGPRPEHIRAFGLKHEARRRAAEAGLPLLPGSGLIQDDTEALRAARRIGYPLMVKSTGGGGGIGLQLCKEEAGLIKAIAVVRRLAGSNFGDSGVYLERFVEQARHIEVQIFGDGAGTVVALGERDCSLQRRNQKILEETPAPNLPAPTRAALQAAAIRLAQSVDYASAGTVEFIYDQAADAFYFLEVNTRLQVEHGVTEEVTGQDLVAWMVLQAAGELPPLPGLPTRTQGASIQVRLYAEDPGKDFTPSAGRVTRLVLPTGVRVESWIADGVVVTPHYDPLLAKIIVSGVDRQEALSRLCRALDETEVYGIETNLEYLKAIAASAMLAAGTAGTRALETFAYEQQGVDVLAPGTQSSLQDFPGRLGLWNVGVPPSGPMDDLSHRLANRLLGNAEDAATLEITARGPILRFRGDAIVVIGGAAIEADLAGEKVPMWTPVAVKAGQTLTCGAIVGPGLRSYLAVRHGFDAPSIFGSCSTFALGKFGGHACGVLRAGDVLRLHRLGRDEAAGGALPDAVRPVLTRSWRIGVLYGPHGAPDYFTDDDIADLFAAVYRVHFNSARTGVRLIGPKPKWARPDGGEAGLHPSNIHDNAYAVGSLDFTGDAPIILGPDGPSLGGFVCPVTVAKSELWKIGQLAPGDDVRFERLGYAEAAALAAAQAEAIAHLAIPRQSPAIDGTEESAIVERLVAGVDVVVIRQAGLDNLLVEIGPPELSFAIRLRIDALMRAVEAAGIDGLLDLTPGIRSLQVHYDSTVVSRATVLDHLRHALQYLPAAADISVPSRIVHLPLSWEDESTVLAIEKYRELVRPDAPWCPSNIEFIRRINGLPDEEAVRATVFAASYLVLGLGDVYLGAPVATPIDPRHRLITTKYNPSRTWTPENAVGIGGAYLCIYGMEGPGGYQLVGRTLQMWNQWAGADTDGDEPWLLRLFDQIRFYPVSAAELAEARAQFLEGGYPIRIEEGRFSLADHEAFLKTNAAEIDGFKARQRAAFEAERARWREQPETPLIDVPPSMGLLPPGQLPLESPLPGTVWKILVGVGDTVTIDQPVVVVESMKMEIEVRAAFAGRVVEIACRAGREVGVGETLIVLQAPQQDGTLIAAELAG